MILDNLSRALKTQNWLAAGIEFVIVIAGVVIGFQINAWNEGRAERAEAAANLELLLEEVRQHEAAAVRMSRWTETVVAHVRTVAAAVEDPEAARTAPGQFASAVYLSRYQTYRPASRTAYEGLERSGAIAQITDTDRLRAIRSYYADLQIWDRVYDGSYDPWADYNDALNGYLTAAQTIAIMDAEPFGAPLQDFSPDEAAVLARKLAADSEVVRLLPAIEVYHTALVRRGESAARSAADLLARFEQSEQP